MAVTAARRRADGDEDGVGAFYAARQIGGELQTPGTHVVGDQFGKARLVNRHDIALKRIDLAFILVDAGHVMAEIGETGP